MSGSGQSVTEAFNCCHIGIGKREPEKLAVPTTEILSRYRQHACIFSKLLRDVS